MIMVLKESCQATTSMEILMLDLQVQVHIMTVEGDGHVNTGTVFSTVQENRIFRIENRSTLLSTGGQVLET